jgi:hypothetical protein
MNPTMHVQKISDHLQKETGQFWFGLKKKRRKKEGLEK